MKVSYMVEEKTYFFKQWQKMYSSEKINDSYVPCKHLMFISTPGLQLLSGWIYKKLSYRLETGRQQSISL